MTNYSDSALSNRFAAWLSPEAGTVGDISVASFFESADVILDANVLLDLYRYTKDGREQVMSALEIFGQRRLWLPHQIGLEFARNRSKAVHGRLASLHAAGKSITSKFETASRLIREARDEVADLIREMAQDDSTADSIVEAIPDKGLQDAFSGWQQLLSGQLKELRAAEAVSPKVIGSNDPLLPKIAQLYGESIGQAYPEDKLRDLVDQAINYRYPNKIPPGFADSNKGTELLAAGDFIAWEQVISHACTMSQPRRIIFVSGDTKGDWYELDPNGKPVRPWPALHDEMRRRADAEVLVLTPRQFLKGTQQFLNARVGEETYEEVDRVSYSPTKSQLEPSSNLGSLYPRLRDDWASPTSATSDGELGRLRRRLQRNRVEYNRLIEQLQIARMDTTGTADVDDPRSFAKAVESRALLLDEQALEIERQIFSLET